MAQRYALMTPSGNIVPFGHSKPQITDADKALGWKAIRLTERRKSRKPANSSRVRRLQAGKPTQADRRAAGKGA